MDSHTSTQLLAGLQSALDDLWDVPVYELATSQKHALLLPILRQLNDWHTSQCPAYANIGQANFALPLQSLEDLPYLAVRLFKLMRLSSMPDEDIVKVVQSSGTSGQQPSTMLLDKTTSARQSKALVKVMQPFLGRQRLPMLIVDSPDVITQRNQFNARAAGVQGFSLFGRAPVYALNPDMTPNWPVIDEFVEQYQDQEVLVFGFTYLIWLYLVQPLAQQGRTLNLAKGIMVHGGGWKKLIDQAVTNGVFKAQCSSALGLSRIHNFYGMAEQVGSIFVECEAGHLHTPVYADVLVRDTQTLAPCPAGQEGLIQVVSVLPTSYPGNSLLTEDLGQWLGEDDCRCGRKGRYFSVSGRLPRAEVRGCSDTHSGSVV